MKKLCGLIIIFIFLVCGWEELTLAQSQKSPIPEFYGIYLVSNGELIEPDIVKLKFEGIPIHMGLMGKVRGGIEVLPKINVGDEKTYIILYHNRIIPSNIKLAHLIYKQNERFTFLSSSYPKKEKERIVDMNMWLMDEPVTLKIAPIEDKKDMYRLVPNRSLLPGVYALHTGELTLQPISVEIDQKLPKTTSAFTVNYDKHYDKHSQESAYDPPIAIEIKNQYQGIGTPVFAKKDNVPILPDLRTRIRFGSKYFFTKITTRVEKGTRLSVLGYESGHYNVKTPDGIIGWVNKVFVKYQ